MWILILKTHGGAGAGGQNGHSNHNHALFIERAHAAPRGESAVERETADLTPTNTFTQAAPHSNITCSHRIGAHGCGAKRCEVEAVGLQRPAAS